MSLQPFVQGGRTHLIRLAWAIFVGSITFSSQTVKFCMQAYVELCSLNQRQRQGFLGMDSVWTPPTCPSFRFKFLVSLAMDDVVSGVLIFEPLSRSKVDFNWYWGHFKLWTFQHIKSTFSCMLNASLANMFLKIFCFRPC